MNRIKERENKACKKLVATIKSVQERELYSCSLLYSNKKLKISENRSLHRANVKKKTTLGAQKNANFNSSNKNKKELEELIENVILITSCEMGCLPWYDKT